MKTAKTSELTGKALDWAVAKAEGWEGWDWDSGESPAFNARYGDYNFLLLARFCPSSHWASAGPIIKRKGITIIRCDDTYAKDPEGFTTSRRMPVWCATTGQHGVEVSTEHQQHDPMYQVYEDDVTYGPTPLVAAMRAYVASKLGSVVEVPDELLDTTEENVKTYREQGRGKDRAQQPPSAPVGVDDLAASLLDARERMISALGPKFGEAFDGDFDVMRDAAKALAQQPAAVGDEGVRDAWRTLWLVLRQTGPVAVPPYDIVSADWSKCQIEQTVQQWTGTVQLRATLLAAQHREESK